MRAKLEPPWHRLIRFLVRVYHKPMEKFTAQNGREVAKVVTPSGVTGYVDTSIPLGALEGMRDALLSDLGMTLDEYRKTYGPAASKENPASR